MLPCRRGVAQPGSAHVWGACGRRFKSSRPDHPPSLKHLAKSANLTNFLFKHFNQKLLGAALRPKSMLTKYFLVDLD